MPDAEPSVTPADATPAEEPRRGWLIRSAKWHRHPGVRTGSQLTPGERAADMVRNGPYPWILLNLILSTLAGIQGAILLIAARRADQVSSETALHTLHNTESLKRLIEQNTQLTRHVSELSEAVHAHLLGGGITPGRAGSS